MNSRPFWQHFVTNKQNLIAHSDKLSNSQRFSLMAGSLVTLSYLLFITPAYYFMSRNYEDIYSLYSRQYTQLMIGLESELFVIKVLLGLGAVFVFCSAYFVTYKMYQEKLADEAEPNFQLIKPNRRTKNVATDARHRAS